MSKSSYQPNLFLILLLLLLGLSGCSGAKILSEPKPLVLNQPLSTTSNQTLSVSLEWVIYRDGPGTWAKNADWDEYLMVLENLSDESLQITNIVVTDSLGTQIAPRQNRKELVKGSKETIRRYKGEGLKVKAGVSAGILVGAGAVAAAGTSGIGAAAMAGGGAAAGAAVIVVAVPVVVVAGLIRGANNSKVNNEIKSRQTLLPVVLPEKEKQRVNLFFPLAPSPRQIEITYIDSAGDHKLFIDTQAVLEGLHILKKE